jgi:hypothetical protein
MLDKFRIRPCLKFSSNKMSLVKQFERLLKFNRAISGIMFLLMLLRWNMMLFGHSKLVVKCFLAYFYCCNGCCVCFLCCLVSLSCRFSLICTPYCCIMSLLLNSDTSCAYVKKLVKIHYVLSIRDTNCISSDFIENTRLSNKGLDILLATFWWIKGVVEGSSKNRCRRRLAD